MKKILIILSLLIVGTQETFSYSPRRVPYHLFSLGVEGLFMKRECDHKERVLITTTVDQFPHSDSNPDPLTPVEPIPIPVVPIPPTFYPMFPILTDAILGNKLTYNWSLGEMGHLFWGRGGECVVRYRGPITSSISVDLDQISAPEGQKSPYYRLVSSGKEDIYYSHAKKVVTTWNTRFTTLDAEYWRHVTPRLINVFSLSWAAGIQAFQLKETLNFDFTRDVTPINGQYDVSIKNRGLGPQLGGVFEWNPTSLWTWQLFLKGSLLYNEGNRTRRFMTDIPTEEILREENFAYGFQGGVGLEMHPMQQMTLSVNYPFLYMKGLVGSFDDLSLTKKTGMSSTDKILYHGLVLSVECLF
ncbi:MAG: hypothetical protein VXZ72_01665 [Chlamydiota bacterium]|nr:hypothetical protein [Chlamydiota bacterium]